VASTIHLNRLRRVPHPSFFCLGGSSGEGQLPSEVDPHSSRLFAATTYDHKEVTITTNVTRYSKTVVGLVLALCLFCFSAAFAQQQMDAATKEDIQQLLEITGARRNIQVMWDSMAQQAASMAADSYQRKHPNSSPLETRKAAELAGECTQKTIKAFSIDELFEVMIPV
jgi:hypothetical protein